METRHQRRPVNAVIDWLDLLRSNNIPYIDAGPNVAKNNVNVKCPFCRDDPTYHMGISLVGKGWSCWRWRNHSGHNPAKLLAALLECSVGHAQRLIGEDVVKLDEFEHTFAALEDTEEVIAPKQAKTLAFPTNTYPLTDQREPFFTYMWNKRRFGVEKAYEAIWGHDLRYAITGTWAGRIIVPIECGGLVNWTGRAIGAAQLRYKTLGKEASAPDCPASLKQTDTCLLFYDKLLRCKGTVLVVCEGPFDALKIECFGNGHVHSTCLFTSNMTRTQKAMLMGLAKTFKHIYIMLDADLYQRSCELADALLLNNVSALAVPFGVKDPGEFTPDQATQFVADMLSLDS